MAIIKGGDLMLFLKENDKNFKSIAQATNHTLNINADTVETSTKDTGGKWQTSEVNMLSWSASSENLVCDSGEGMTYADLFEIMTNRKVIEGIFALEGDNTDLVAKAEHYEVPTGGWSPKTTDGLTGKMVITSLVKNAPNGDNASFTVEFTGVGPLTKVKDGTTVMSLNDV